MEVEDTDYLTLFASRSLLHRVLGNVPRVVLFSNGSERVRPHVRASREKFVPCICLLKSV